MKCQTLFPEENKNNISKYITCQALNGINNTLLGEVSLLKSLCLHFEKEQWQDTVAHLNHTASKNFNQNILYNFFLCL